MQIPQNKNPISRVGCHSDDHNLTIWRTKKTPTFRKEEKKTTGAKWEEGVVVEECSVLTTEGEAIAGNNTSLDDSVLLACEGSTPDATFGKNFGSRLDEEESQQTRWDVQGRNDTHCEIQLVGDDAE